MIKIEIQSTEVETKSGTSSKTGKPYSISEQDGWGYFHDQSGKVHPHPMKIRIMLEKDQAPYAPGLYTLAPESLYPDRFGQITIRPKLKALVASAKQAAAA